MNPIDPAAPISRRSLLQLGAGVAGVIGLGAVLSACGDSGSQSSTSGRTTVSWGAQQFFTDQSTNTAVAAYLKAAITAYEDANGATVTLEVQSSDNAAAMSRLLQQASQGRAADVAMVDSYIFPQFEEYAQEIQDVTGPAGVELDDFFPFFQPLVGDGDVVRGLPLHTDVRMLYYRKDLVQTPPTSWDELVETSKALAEDGRYFMFPAGRSEDPLMCSIWPWYWSNGAEIVGDDGTAAFTSGAGYDAMLETLEFIRRCVDEGITPSRVSTFMVSDDMLPDIIGDRVAMFVGGSWMATNMQDQLGGDVTEKWAVAPIPSKDGTTFATASGGWMYGCFATDDARRKAGAKFVVDTYVETDAMAEFCTAAGYLPARESVYDSAAFTGGPFTPEFRDSLSSYAKSRPGSPDYPSISAAMQVALSAVASQAQEPKAALDTAIGTL